MLPLSLLCNLCVCRIILPREEEDDSEQQSPKPYHHHNSNQSGCPVCTSTLLLSSPLKNGMQTTACIPVVGEEFCCSSLVMLTVRKKPIVFSGGGFSVTDSRTGQIVFRVDGRGLSSTNRLILMDAAGKPLLTLHRKPFTIHNRWYGFLGEKIEGQKPIFSLRKSMIFNMKTVAEVFVSYNSRGKKQPDYKVSGSYRERNCSVYNGNGAIIAEVKRKCATSEVMLSKDVFNVVVSAGVDQAFMMGLVVVLDRMSEQNNLQ